MYFWCAFFFPRMFTDFFAFGVFSKDFTDGLLLLAFFIQGSQSFVACFDIV